MRLAIDLSVPRLSFRPPIGRPVFSRERSVDQGAKQKPYYACSEERHDPAELQHERDREAAETGHERDDYCGRKVS